MRSCCRLQLRRQQLLYAIAAAAVGVTASAGDGGGGSPERVGSCGSVQLLGPVDDAPPPPSEELPTLWRLQPKLRPERGGGGGGTWVDFGHAAQRQLWLTEPGVAPPPPAAWLLFSTL